MFSNIGVLIGTVQLDALKGVSPSTGCLVCPDLDVKERLFTFQCT